MSDGAITMSGKSAATENFPVASWLIAPDYRAPIHAYYRFARAADDIADDPALDAARKVALLNRLEEGLAGHHDDPLARDLREAAMQHGVDLVHARDLLDAFRLDATKARYATWDDLIAYCAKSAMPVGRFVLDVHRENRATFTPSDALCAALQVINHLQDCRDDYRDLDRVYIPLDALQARGLGVEVLAQPSTSLALRTVFDEMLDRTEALLAQSRALSPLVRDRRLRIEVSVIQAVAESLVQHLRRRDPLAERIKLNKLGYALAFARGLIMGLSA